MVPLGSQPSSLADLQSVHLPRSAALPLDIAVCHLPRQQRGFGWGLGRAGCGRLAGKPHGWNITTAAVIWPP